MTLLNGKDVEIAPSPGSGLDKFDVAYFTASCDTVETNTRYAKDLKLDYPILSDPTKSVAKAYGVVTASRSVPFRWTFYIGKDGKIKHIAREVSPRNHAKEIAAQLTKMGVPKK